MAASSSSASDVASTVADSSSSSTAAAKDAIETTATAGWLATGGGRSGTKGVIETMATMSCLPKLIAFDHFPLVINQLIVQYWASDPRLLLATDYDYDVRCITPAYGKLAAWTPIAIPGRLLATASSMPFDSSYYWADVKSSGSNDIRHSSIDTKAEVGPVLTNASFAPYFDTTAGAIFRFNGATYTMGIKDVWFVSLKYCHDKPEDGWVTGPCPPEIQFTGFVFTMDTLGRPYTVSPHGTPYRLSETDKWERVCLGTGPIPNAGSVQRAAVWDGQMFIFDGKVPLTVHAAVIDSDAAAVPTEWRTTGLKLSLADPVPLIAIRVRACCVRDNFLYLAMEVKDAEAFTVAYGQLSIFLLCYETITAAPSILCIVPISADSPVALI